jgi:cellulose synthase/poly-beta-1,6-N-acetylglucosamine synthase-like glycosyltransferase
VSGLWPADVPFGEIPIGAGLCLLLYAVTVWLSDRPSTSGAGTVRAELLREYREGAPVVHLYTKDAERVAQMTGAGEHPSLPIKRALGFVWALLLTFIGTSLVLLWLYDRLFRYYDHLVAYVGMALYWPVPWPGVYAVSVQTLVVPDFIFPMYLAGMISFLAATGLITNRPRFSARRRLLAIATLATYVLVEFLLDALFFTVPGETFRNVALLARGMTGGLFLALLIFCALYLPKPQRVQPRFARDRTAIVAFFGLGSASVGIAAVLLWLVGVTLNWSGLYFGFTLLLLLPILSLTLFGALGRPYYFYALRQRPRPPLSVYHPSVSILVPAYNEEQWIAAALHAADRAAADYPGRTEIIVGNDGSTDRTVEIARDAISRFVHAKGLIVDLPHGGKSNALNGALACASGEIVIRCDGDALISEEKGFAALIPHFADPQVGGVQGAIHQRQKKGWTRKLRALEIAWMHYLLRPAGMGTRSAEVIDGLFSAFRRVVLVRMGGWVPWNGEDTEISIRIQRLGYRVRFEFDALAYEDVPENYDALRRQRVRWARGVLMANGQHYPALLGSTIEFAGLGVFFWFLLVVRSGVRSLVYVYLGLLVVTLGVPALLFTLTLLGLAAIIRAVPISYFLIRMKRFDVLPWVAFFPIGNVIKQTFRFEGYGTLGPGAVGEYI